MKSSSDKEKIFYWPPNYKPAWVVIGVIIGILLWIATLYAYPYLVQLWQKVTSFFWF